MILVNILLVSLLEFYTFYLSSNPHGRSFPFNICHILQDFLSFQNFCKVLFPRKNYPPLPKQCSKSKGSFCSENQRFFPPNQPGPAGPFRKGCWTTTAVFRGLPKRITFLSSFRTSSSSKKNVVGPKQRCVYAITINARFIFRCFFFNSFPIIS